mmetsp:Transcript_13031/g.17765  ORF Transcript_13031/g.17765 Transcript_13031/m.17765 type:complete len:189 (-) Transcript_13031:113-679(-)
MEVIEIADTDIYDYLSMIQEGIKNSAGNPAEGRRILIKFKGWFLKNKFNLLSFVESTSMGSRVLNMRDLRSVFISELDTIFAGLRTVSINRLDDDSIEDMMDDIADFFDCINLESFRVPDYEMSTNLSASLQQILGFSSSVTSVVSDWTPPSAPGLQNSARLVQNESEFISSESKTSDNTTVKKSSQS